MRALLGGVGPRERACVGGCTRVVLRVSLPEPRAVGVATTATTTSSSVCRARNGWRDCTPDPQRGAWCCPPPQDYGALLRTHRESDADITIATHAVGRKQASLRGITRVNPDSGARARARACSGRRCSPPPGRPRAGWGLAGGDRARKPLRCCP